MNNELLLNDNNFKLDINNILNKYKNEIKLKKYKYENNKKEIYNKY